MADIYVRSTDGSDSDNGSTWALAKATLGGAAAIAVAGDRIFVSQNHNESTGASVTNTFAGTLGNPIVIMCVDDTSGTPPTTRSTGAIVEVTGAFNYSNTGSIDVYGISFRVGNGASTNQSISLAADYNGQRQRYTNCEFRLLTTDNNGRVATSAGGSAAGYMEFINCGFLFSAQFQGVSCAGAVVTFKNCYAISGTTTVLGFFKSFISKTLVEGFDFSNFGTTLDVGSDGSLIMRNSRLPASWAGNFFSASGTGMRGEMWNCDSGDTNYRMRIQDREGLVRDETTVVKTGGASDNTTPLSWRVVTTANASLLNPFELPDIFSERITTGLGSPRTLTVDIMHDSVTALTDAEIWVEVQYMGTSGFPITTTLSDIRGASANDAFGNRLTSAANQASSAASWTTTGLTNPNAQKLEVTFTPQEAGVVIATVYVAKASYTVFVDPVAQLSGSAGTVDFALPGGGYVNITESVAAGSKIFGG